MIQFAIRIEENGERFYRNAERVAKDEHAKQLFKRLADEEIAHRALFQKMIEVTSLESETEDYEGEYMAHLRGHIDGRAVFETDAIAGDDTRSVLEAAMQRELNAMLYYDELKKFVPEKDHKVLDDIVDEERRHFAELSSIKRDMR
ncbi:MAG TPA: ferritin family protein [Anaeromyxobacteraceae bacterium]|nr:ferritin family protein [Anaeromyxobacteraceae bacterium]